MESSEQMGVYIFSPISTNRLIFGKGAFFILIFLNIPTHRINFKNWNFCEVTLLFFDTAVRQL